MSYLKDVKVYFDGSHHIGIPYQPQPWKRRKIAKFTQEQNSATLPEIKEKISNDNATKSNNESEIVATADDLKELFDRLYEDLRSKKRKEKYEVILEKVKNYLNEEKAKEFLDKQFARKLRNIIERRKRFVRKVRQQKWDYFVTFTYDDKLHNEETFRKSLMNCLKHLASRKDWRYVGVWERSPEKQRLHFHGLFIIPNMVGEFEEIKDYSTKTHQMQIANQNTFFKKRFGRNDFSKIENDYVLNDSIKYLMKYLEKSGEKIVYSKGLYTYFVTDILEEDIVCPIGQEDRKILLFDNFKCMDLETGEFLGTVSQETKDKCKKSN